MAKFSVVEMNIYGRVATSEEAFSELAATAACASSSPPWESGYSSDDFFAELVKAELEKRAIKFELHDDWDIFETLRTECQAAGLSYLAYTADGSESGWSGVVSWRPGMESEYEFAVSGEHAQPMVPVKALRAAQAKGPDAVSAIVESLEANTRIGVVEIDPAFLEAYSRFNDETPVVQASHRL